ncbi:MAG: biphenyl 2,3-dioxygenase [Gammaproteobacteria bacterium]|nr:biphenyl 2,3-dioxygenase [Gammaproteobacteria bacterium]
MSSPTKLAHVAIKTPNMKEAKAWYLAVLDGRVQFENEMLCFLCYDDEHHRVVLVNDPGFDKSANMSGLHHVSFTYDSLDDLFDTFEKLQKQDIIPFWTINHGITMSMYYLDPMGNSIELQIDIMDLEEANAFMQGEVFAKNPIGIDFDANQLNAKRKAGVAYEELVQYG